MTSHWSIWHWGVGCDRRFKNGEPGLFTKIGIGLLVRMGLESRIDWSLAARRDAIWGEYVGQGPRVKKSLVTKASKLARMSLSTVNSHSK
jgi:hypothetical protein